MRKYILTIMVAVGFLAGQAALAAEFLAPDRADNGNVTVAGSETRRNLYTAGANVNINGPISGDLFAAGSAVTVNGTVERDIMAAGGSLNINGAVGGNAHLAGGTMVLNAPVGGDLFVAGGNVTVSERSSVGGDLVVAGGNVSVDGPVTGNIRVGGGNVTINGRVAGNIYARAELLTFGPRSEVVGRVQLKSPKEAVVKEGARVSSIDYTRIEMGRDAGRAIPFGSLLQVIAWFIVGWLLTRFARALTRNTTVGIMRNFWGNLGIGLLILIVTPILIVLLFLTVVGYYLAILLILAYILLLMLSAVLAAVFVGAWIWKLVKKEQGFRLDWLTVLIGVIVVSLVSWIPFIGWLAAFILFLVALGSASRSFLGVWRSGEYLPETTATTPPPPTK